MQVLVPGDRGRGELSDPAFASSAQVALDDVDAVRGVRQRRVELLGVPQSLLQPILGGAVLALGFDDDRGGTRDGTERVVDVARAELTGYATQCHHALGSDRELLDHLIWLPAGSLNCGNHKIATRVALLGSGSRHGLRLVKSGGHRSAKGIGRAD